MNSDPTLLVLPHLALPRKRIRSITVIYNVVKDLSYGEKEDLLADEDTIVTAQEVAKALETAGFRINLFELNKGTIDELLELKTDLVFNLCYGVGSIPKTEGEVAKILESKGVPFTGGGSWDILLTDDKIATKKRFIKNNIPTPKYQVFVSGEDNLSSNLHYPLIVKPSCEDCSLGIHNQAVVKDWLALQDRISYLLKIYKEPVLVEEYIEGRELNITIIGNNGGVKVLPISEIVFGDSYTNGSKWKIVDFEAKWITDSTNYKETVGVCPALLESDVLRHIEKLAILAYKSCGCKDYARIDLRLAQDNTPYFLEINLNPGIGPADGAVRSAKAAGFTYITFLKELVRVAVLRY